MTEPMTDPTIDVEAEWAALLDEVFATDDTPETNGWESY